MSTVRAWDIYVWQGEIITGFHVGEFSRGEVIRYPLRCTWDAMTRTDQREKSIVRSRRQRRPYRVVAEVLQVTKHALIIDFGIPAFARPFLVYKRPFVVPDDLAPGAFIAGDLTLLLDSVEEARVLGEVRDFDALYRLWEIQRITKRTVPLVQAHNVSGIQNFMRGDESRARCETVERTDGLSIGAVHNDGMDVDYWLRCRLLKDR